MSSGIWNSKSSGTGTSISTGPPVTTETVNNELIINQRDYQKLIELTEKVINTSDSWFPHNHHSNKDQHNIENRHYRYLTLSLCKHRFREFLQERHETHFYTSRRRNRSYIDHHRQQIEEEKDEAVQELIVMDDKLILLYLLSTTNNFSQQLPTPGHQQCSVSESKLNFSSLCQEKETFDITNNEQFEELEVFLMAKRGASFTDSDDDGDEYTNLEDSDLNICSDCTKSYLIDGLIDQVSSIESRKKYEVENINQLYALSLLFNCPVRQLKQNKNDELLTNRIGKKSPEADITSSKKNLKNQSPNNTKLLSNSHEKIINFLQILLPKSAKLGSGNGTRSAGNGRKGCTNQQSIREHHCKVTIGQERRATKMTTTRRSSSAYVLGEEVMKSNIHRSSCHCNISYLDPFCIKSCSQLQVISGGSICQSNSSQVNSKSSSYQDTRCRSVISDVVVVVPEVFEISDANANDKNNSPNRVIVIHSPSSNEESSLVNSNSPTEEQCCIHSVTELCNRSPIHTSVQSQSRNSLSIDVNETIDLNKKKYHSYEFIHS